MLLHRENKMLQNALEVARSRDGFSGVEKQQLLEQISELQNTLADQSRTLHVAQKDNTQLREEVAALLIKANKFDEIAPKHQALQEEKDLNWDKFLLDLLQFTLGEKSELELVKKLLVYLVNTKSMYTSDQVKEKINYIRNENDFSEYRYYLKDLEQLEKIV